MAEECTPAMTSPFINGQPNSNALRELVYNVLEIEGERYLREREGVMGDRERERERQSVKLGEREWRGKEGRER